MKRLVIILPIAALASVLLLRMNANQMNAFSITVMEKEQKKVKGSDVKYQDCLKEQQLIAFKASLKKEEVLPNPKQTSKIDVHLKKYQVSLDSTVQSLNAIDAHSFLHSEYERSRQMILSNRHSRIKTYYHLKIMESCYEKDKKLNLSSQSSLAKL